MKVDTPEDAMTDSTHPMQRQRYLQPLLLRCCCFLLVMRDSIRVRGRSHER